jgi:DNA-binding NarL/FixJ family response regulator
MAPISLLLVDDSATFLRLVSRFLSEQYPDEVVIVGVADGGEAGLAQAHALRPDIVLIDLVMPGLPGLKAIPLLRAALPNLNIIALTLMEPNGYRQAALAAGADEFVSKATLATDLLPAIRRVMQADRLLGKTLNKPAATTE